MNARQKAKHYKKLYERQLAMQPTDLQVHNFKTDFIKVCTMIPYEKAKYYPLHDYSETIKTNLAYELTKELINKMDIEVFDYPEQCAYKLYGSVRIVTGVYY